MAVTSKLVFLGLYCLAAVVTLVAIGLTAAAVLSSGWQIMVEPGSGETHQHGLWIDFNHVKPHVAGVPPSSDHNDGWQWIFNYKYGSAVNGDESHRAKRYQEITLILLSISVAVAIMAVLISVCAVWKACFGIFWTISLFVAMVLGIAGLAEFYFSAMLPDNRYVYTDRRIEQVIGYSFDRGAVGVAGFGLAMILSIVCNVLNIISRRNEGMKDERPFVFVKGNNTQV